MRRTPECQFKNEMAARGDVSESLIKNIVLAVSFVVGVIASPQVHAADPAPSSEVTPAAATEGERVPEEEFQRRFPDRAPEEFPGYIYESIPPIENSASDFVPTPDRWRMFYAGKWYDPYNQNVLKGDIPVFGKAGEEWFTELSIISDTLYEARRLPVPVGFASTKRPNSNNVFGDGDQWVFVQNVITSFGLIKGNTSFKPPDFELRIAPVFNFNHVEVDEDGIVKADPTAGDVRSDNYVGFQELFADIHLANISERYDFVSSRIGIQQFNADFRGFLYNDNQPGARFFGNYDNNKTQFNLAAFSRLDKDVNSGINTMFTDRHEDVYVANMFRQDMLALGHTMLFSVVHREDTAGDAGERYDRNNFLVRPVPLGDQRPKNIYSTYLGIGGDGHFGRVNTTTQFYYVTGSESHNQLANRQVDINAGMFAQELSYDIDFVRVRTSVMWASGDRDPYDGKATGFDAIFDNPNFAGGDLAFWQRQAIPFIGGGGTNLVNRNSLLPNLRPTKELGQSNFVNPGLRVYNIGMDVEVLPELKVISNVSYLQFDQTATLEALRQDGSIARDIGVDLSLGLLYRPFLNNNVQVRVGSGVLLPAAGHENLFGDRVNYDAFTNLIFQY
jgi:hypothetical protein